MAGLNLLIKKNKEHNTVRINSDFCPGILTSQDIWLNKNLELSIHKHKGYPYKTYSNDKYDVFIEGKVYNLNEQSLLPILDKLFDELAEITPNKKNITDLLFKMDGDYILIFYDKINQKTYLLNDLYGRLPIYYTENEENFMISRNIEVISNTLGIKELDKYGVAEFLVFGYTVTERTLIEGINYFLPGSLLTYNIDKNQHHIENIFTFNFEKLVSVTKKNYKAKLKESVTLFEQANLRRSYKTSVIGLSGGLDSRVLAAALKNVNPSVNAVSRLSFNNREKLDVAIAKQIAETLNFPFQIVKSHEPDDSHINDIISLKGGLNSIENDYNLIYEKKIQSIYGSDFIYFTGDGGDRIKPHIKINKANDLNDFVQKLIETNSRINLHQVVKMLGIDSVQFQNNIYNYVSSFPESSYGYKYLHFWIYNRGFRYVLEGEDRKRNFFWTVVPFYDHDFFLSVMSFPDSFKKDYKMFIDFMNVLDPRLSQIVNKNWNLRPDDWRLKLYLMKDLIPRKVRKHLQNLLNITKKESAKIDNDTITKYLVENQLYNKDEYSKLLKSLKPNRSFELFVRSPVFLDNYLKKYNAK